MIDLSDADPVPTITLGPGERFVARAATAAAGVAPAESGDETVLRRTGTGTAAAGASLAEFQAVSPGTAVLSVDVTSFGSLAAPGYGLTVRVPGLRAPGGVPRIGSS